MLLRQVVRNVSLIVETSRLPGAAWKFDDNLLLRLAKQTCRTVNVNFNRNFVSKQYLFFGPEFVHFGRNC